METNQIPNAVNNVNCTTCKYAKRNGYDEPCCFCDHFDLYTAKTNLSDVYNDIRSIINEWDLAKSSLVAGDNPSKYLNMIKIIIDRFEEEHKED